MLNKTLCSCVSKISLIALLGVAAPNCADALGYRVGDWDFRLSGYGMAGIIEPNFDDTLFLGDFSVRGQVQYDATSEHRFGAVYVIDALALDEHHWAHQAFGFWQWSGVGRLEAGMTESVAHKLGLGLPDVGGLRVNENSWLFKKMGAEGPVIANTVLTTGHESLRVNLVSVSNDGVQYGVTVSGLTDQYDVSAGAGIKLKYSEGKTKFAFSFGTDFISNLDGYTPDVFTAPIYADWRGQVALGMNVQYNSFVIGVNGRAIYDQDALGAPTDGLAAGIGASYDLLNYSLSLSYMMSDTGVWQKDVHDYIDNTVIGSFRCKYSKNVDFWTSIGVTRRDPFLAAALRVTF